MLSHRCVPAFGYLRIYAHLQLPVAFRSLSRPSSAPDAKASSVCSYQLNLQIFFPRSPLLSDLRLFPNINLQSISLTYSFSFKFSRITRLQIFLLYMLFLCLTSLASSPIFVSRFLLLCSCQCAFSVRSLSITKTGNKKSISRYVVPDIYYAQRYCIAIHGRRQAP